MIVASTGGPCPPGCAANTARKVALLPGERRHRSVRSCASHAAGGEEAIGEPTEQTGAGVSTHTSPSAAPQLSRTASMAALPSLLQREAPCTRRGRLATAAAAAAAGRSYARHEGAARLKLNAPPALDVADPLRTRHRGRVAGGASNVSCSLPDSEPVTPRMLQCKSRSPQKVACSSSWPNSATPAVPEISKRRLHSMLSGPPDGCAAGGGRETGALGRGRAGTGGGRSGVCGGAAAGCGCGCGSGGGGGGVCAAASTCECMAGTASGSSRAAGSAGGGRGATSGSAAPPLPRARASMPLVALVCCGCGAGGSSSSDSAAKQAA